MTVDLRTRYLGLELRSPIIASAAPQNGEPVTAGLLERAGVGAIVLPSLFEEEILAEEIELNRSLEQGTEHFAEALDYFPAVDEFVGAADRYLASLERVKSRAAVPIIASLNASSTGGWVRYARLIQDAGADALELNLYRVAADPRQTAAEMEGADLELIAAVRASVTIPLAVKLSPYYSAFANFAAGATRAGADGLVLFNRFYQPDLDLDALEVVPRVELSQPWEMRLPVRWIAILRPQLGPGVSLAATSGAHTGTDVIKGLMVGADVVMMTSALLRHGPEHIGRVEAELRAWMTEHEYESVEQLRGSASHATAENPSAFERANYIRTLRSWVAPRELTSTTPTGRPRRHLPACDADKGPSGLPEGASRHMGPPRDGDTLRAVERRHSPAMDRVCDTPTAHDHRTPSRGGSAGGNAGWSVSVAIEGGAPNDHGSTVRREGGRLDREDPGRRRRGRPRPAPPRHGRRARARATRPTHRCDQ